MIAGMTVLPRAAYAEGLDDAAIVAADKESLAIGFSVSDSVYGVTDDLTLPLTGASGSAITWLSDTPEVIAHDGAVTRPAADAGDAEVTLTATITYGGVSDSKEFALTVEAASALMIGPLAAMVGIQAGLPETKSGHKNNAANTTQISFGGAVWYVIGYNGSGVESSSGTMTLLHNAGGGWYSIFGANSAYSGSTLQNTMNNAYNGLPIKEQNMVMAHSLVGISGDPVTDAKFWPLSSDEANLITADVRKYFTNWWLRTPGSESTAHLVHGDGSAPFPAYTVENGNTCARPAFILNTESILFTSPREGASAKDSVSVGDGLVGAAAPSGTLKFTAQDSDLDNLNLTSASLNQITVKSGENVTVTFAGAKTGLGKYVSCVIVDSNDKVTHYGKLSGEASGTANFTVPALADGNYKMKLFNEQVSEPLYEVNRDAYIDFCSTPIEITMAVDNTAPALTAGTVNRTSDTAATVTFNSDEAGTYYYQLNTAPADAAALANAGTNQTAMTAGEQTIPLTGITAGVHTIYVAAKDALGNVSSLLTLNIPACKYTVTYNANGGTVANPTTEVTYDSADALLVPTRAGYTFGGWYDGADGTGNQVTSAAGAPTGTVAGYVNSGKWSLTEGKTVHAKWTANQYTVTFSVYGGTAVPAVTQDYDTQIAAAPVSTKTGHTLAGWYSDAELTTVATFPYTITGDSTLYAKWTVNQYTVTFNANDGTAVPAVTQDYDTQIATAPASTKTGHSHAGWYTDAGLNTAATFPYTITENSTLYAKWTANEYTITVQNDGNGTASANTASAAQDTEITLTATPKEGYQFKEWQVISGGITISNNKFTMPAAGVTIKAIFAVKSSGGNGGGSAPSGILVPPIGKDIADSGVSLSFPAGAVEGDIRVQVKEAALTTGMELPDDSKLLSKVVDIVKNRSGNFAQPVTITMSFNKSQVDPEKYDIKICCFDEQSGEWVELGNIKVDLDGSAVSGQVDHFTKFAVIATRTPAPQPEIKLPADIANHWGKDSIVKLMQAGVIVGYPDGSFQPEKSVSRAEFTVMLVKALKLESKQGGLSFKDTAAHWAKDSINAAAAHGIISGYDQNSFGPDDQIIREQAAIIIARATKLQAGDQALSFSDAQQISPWALSGVAAAVGKSYLSGYPDNSFRPQGYTSRAEAAAIIAKLL